MGNNARHQTISQRASLKATATNKKHIIKHQGLPLVVRSLFKSLLIRTWAIIHDLIYQDLQPKRPVQVDCNEIKRGKLPHCVEPSTRKSLPIPLFRATQFGSHSQSLDTRFRWISGFQALTMGVCHGADGATILSANLSQGCHSPLSALSPERDLRHPRSF